MLRRAERCGVERAGIPQLRHAGARPGAPAHILRCPVSQKTNGTSTDSEPVRVGSASSRIDRPSIATSASSSAAWVPTYRSRFAELLFNVMAPERGTPWPADSGGTDIVNSGRWNIGPVTLVM